MSLVAGLDRHRFHRFVANCSRVVGVVGCLSFQSFGTPRPQSTTRQDAPPVRISLDYAGGEAFGLSYCSSTSPMSADGRFVAFVSQASLVPNDVNGLLDAYVYDSATGDPPELISVNTAGFAGNLDTRTVDVSDDGRFVSFESIANDLVSGDNNNASDAFVRDRLLGITYLCSVSSTGVQGFNWSYVRISGEGRYVVFSSSAVLVPGDLNGMPDVFVRDLQSSTTERVSVSSSGVGGNSSSGNLEMMDITPDGRFVCFASEATNLAPNDSNGTGDVFVRDRVLGQTQLISYGSSGQQGNAFSSWPAISSDGCVVAFMSWASNLVPGDTNGTWDIFVRDMLAGSTLRVSVDSGGAEANDMSGNPVISPDGRFVGFLSRASDLVSADTNGAFDCFVHDRLTRRMTRVSTNANSVEANARSNTPALARDGRTIAFSSEASNLISGDTNGVADVFVRRWPAPHVYCTAKTNSQGCVSAIATSGVPMASFPRGFVVSASNLLNRKLGLLIYSTGGPVATPFQGGTLCLRLPFRRTQHQLSGGSPSGLDCTGRFDYDFNGWIAGGADPTLSAGRDVWAQYWSRDPGFAAPNNSNLTNAVTFHIDP